MAQLELVLDEENIDIICISELGSQRQIRGFPNYLANDKYRQSAIFWKRGLQVEKIQTMNNKHERTLTQRIMVNKELLLIHPYIGPERSNTDRKKYWKDLHLFIDN